MQLSKRRRIFLISLAIIPLLVFIAVSLIFSHTDSIQAASYIKWVDFNVTAEIMREALRCDIESYEKALTAPTVHHAKFVELIALAATKYGGEFAHCKPADISSFANRISKGESAEDIAGKLSGGKNYKYFLSAYESVLGGFVGSYSTVGETGTTQHYGLKVFSPIAAGYYYNDYNDFGTTRSYGYRRPHLGHDMMGSVGTPIIAVESGYVEACGWNQYGGWRIGIRSFDGKRYYYYAHLRRDHPYNDIFEGKQITAGEVIGYLGMTGYSAKENVNNIDIPHLHFGVQLIFDKSQKDGTNQIWIDLYEYTKFLSKYRSEVYFDKSTNEFYAKNQIIDPDIPD